MSADVTDMHRTFFSNHAHVLACLAESPEATLREVAKAAGITERSAQRIITQLGDPQTTRRVANQPLARDFVYATLRTQFPCKAPEDE